MFMPKDRQPSKYEWRIPFGKENETLSKENFGTAFVDFCNASYAKGAPREKDETELHYTQRVTETRTAARLCADAVINKIVGMLTHEQKMQIYQDAPDKEYIPRSVRGKFTRILKGPDSDYQKKVDLSKVEGPDQAKYIAEVKALDVAGNILNEHISIEEAKEAVKDLLTPEQIAEVADPANNITPKFIIDNREYVQGKLAEMLTPEQMNELKATADNYIVPWERTPEEMGEKAYTAESDKAKADIDAREDLSQEQKDEMKADIDAANDFLRRPLAGEDPQSTYFALSTAYEHAALTDGEKAGEAMMKEQGFDYNVMNQEFNMATMSVDPILNEDKREEFDKWNEQEYKISPKTKESILTLVSKMKEFGYGGKGVIKEQGEKEYGLSMLAKTIKDYKKAVESGDATKIAEASKTMLQEKEHVNEMLDFVRENFPVDRTSDNFAKPGNIDVVRNGTFPPEYRYDEAVTVFNSVFIAMNYAQANGMTMEEFLDHPSQALRDSYYGENALGIDKGMKGKAGGAALFEASRRDERVLVTANSYGAARAFEGLLFYDSDPEIRAHNAGLNKFLYENVIQNAELSDCRRRVVAYTKGHLDRLLFVTEPREDASLLGIKVYDPKTFSYKEPEAFNELEYLQTNGKSVGEMKEFLDNSIKEFYHLSKTQKVLGSNGRLYEQPAFAGNRLLELAQEAASKVLMAKHAEKDDPSYQALKGLLTNGKDYLLDLVMPEEERQKLVDAQKQLAQAQKDGNTAEIARLQKYVNEHDDIVTETTDKYAKKFETFEQKVAGFHPEYEVVGDFEPDEEFNKSMLKLKDEELAGINSRIAARVGEIGAENVATDEIIQVLNITREQKLTELKQAYIKQLGEDVKSGRISEGYKREREKQLNDPNYQYDVLPDLFPQSYDMTEEQKAERQRDMAQYVLKQNAEVLGFVTTVPEVKAEEKAVEAEKQEEKEPEPVDFSGRWFKPGQQVTNDVLLDKVTELRKALTTPIVGDNWLKNREEFEARERDETRMFLLVDEAWKTLSDNDKQKVYDVMDADSKESAMRSKSLSQLQIQRNPAIWEPLIKAIPEDQVRSVALKADTKLTAMERMTLDEAKVTQYEKEFDSVKTMFGQMSFLDGKPLTNERKAEIMAKFDHVQDMMSGIDSSYIKEVGDLRLDREQGQYGINNTRRAYGLQGLKAQGFNVTPRGNMEMIWAGEIKEKFKTESGEEKWEIVKPEAQEDYQRLKEQKFEYRPETKKAIKDIFAKFDEYGLDDAPFKVEEGENKVYALHKYGKAHDEFWAKIKSDDPVDKLQALGLADKMIQEYDRAKELIGMASKLYGVEDGGFFPGNMDVERTRALPPEFRTDTKGTSALNGIYLVYRELKEQNYDYDKFLEDPRAFLNHQVEKHVKKDDINLSIKGKSGAEAMYEAFVPVQQGNIDLYETSRLAENLSEMEKDPALREKNLAAEYSHILSGQKVISLLSGVRNELWQVATKHTERFLLVKDPQQDASLLGVHTMDFNTRTIIPPKQFDEMEYLMNNPEDPKEFADRVMREGGKFMEMIAKDQAKPAKERLSVSELQPIRCVRAMQRAAIKFLTARPDIDKHSEAYRTLNSLATDAPNFIKNMLTEQVSKGQIHLNVDELELDEIENFRLKQSLADFKKSDTMKYFGETVRDEDKDLNKDLKDMQKDVERAQKDVDRAKSDVQKAEAQQRLDEAQKKLNEAVKERKDELLQAFRAGKITEDYLNRRNEQLDGRKFGDNPPKMFEADQLMSKNDYLRDYAKKFNEKNPGADFDLDELSKEEKNELYDRYVENAKRTKEQFIANKYMQSEDLTSKVPQQTMAERIAAEDARLTRLGEAPIKGNTAANKKVDEPQVKQDEPQVKQPQVENIDIDLEDEPQIQNKAEQKVEQPQVEVKEEVQNDKNLGERFDLDLDDEAEELNNDMLNFGKDVQKQKDFDPLKK